MDNDEKVAFYEEISNRGYLIHDSDEGGVYIQKISTFKDSGTSVAPMLTAMLVNSQEDAIALIKGLINWDYKPLPVTPVMPVIEVKSEEGMAFEAIIMYDLGYGYSPESLNLGTIKDCDSNMAQEIAESRAKDHFDKYIPKADFYAVKKQIRLRLITGTN